MSVGQFAAVAQDFQDQRAEDEHPLAQHDQQDHHEHNRRQRAQDGQPVLAGILIAGDGALQAVEQIAGRGREHVGDLGERASKGTPAGWAEQGVDAGKEFFHGRPEPAGRVAVKGGDLGQRLVGEAEFRVSLEHRAVDALHAAEGRGDGFAPGAKLRGVGASGRAQDEKGYRLGKARWRSARLIMAAYRP